MTALTPKLGLRYPTGTDAPCDGGQQIIDLRDDIYDRLDDYTTIIARQADLPTVSVAWRGPAQLVTAGTIRFDTVEQDDVRAADLIAANTRIVLGQPGFEGTYLVGFLVKGDDPGTGYSLSMVGDTVNTFPAYDYDLNSWWMDTSLTIEYPMHCGTCLALISGPTQVKLIGSPVFVVFARMWAVRVGSI